MFPKMLALWVHLCIWKSFIAALKYNLLSVAFIRFTPFASHWILYVERFDHLSYLFPKTVALLT
jgi:hypothetical protein